jgi:DNA-binding transcriptional ArsR family regulator
MPGVKAAGSVKSTLGAVVSHPIRVQALTILTERVASPKQIADTLTLSISDVSYHVRVLKDLGLIEVVREKKVRGAIAHYYRGVARPSFTDEEWAALSIKERNATSVYLLQLAMADAVASLEAGILDARPDRCLTRFPGLVDREGWGELNSLHGEMLDRTMEIQAASAERMAREPEGEQIPITSVAMFFERFNTARQSAWGRRS